MSLLKFVSKYTYDEPLFYQGFGGNIRANFPKLPIEYTKAAGIQLANLSSPIALGVTPKSTDTDIYI